MRIKSKLLILLVMFSTAFTGNAFAGSPAAAYLCEFGEKFYQLGRYDEALTEFNKVLILEPANYTAQQYINKIFQQETTYTPYYEETTIQEPVTQQEQKTISREDAIDEALNAFTAENTPQGIESQPVTRAENKAAGIKISGEVQARVGITPHDGIWKRANWDLNEKNFRMLSDVAFNKRENTYDPRIYDRLSVNVDSDKDKEDGLGFHSNLTVDPWSFTGKSPKMTVTSNFGDTAEVQLKYWSNTGYTVNEIVHSTRFGNSFALNEIKVNNGKTSAFDVNGAFTLPVADTFHIPEAKIDRQFQPLRELWVDYTKQQDLKLRIYPFAYEDQALTFNDPLRLSNNHMWWEDSPWIRSWTPGVLNSGLTPVDFNKGSWDNTLSFFTRDSEGRRLTGLRGFSFDFYPQESTYLQTSVASPKTLWQDYSDFDNFLSATHLTQRINDSLDLGVTATTRFGYNIEDNSHLDAKNFVGAADLSYEITNGLKASAEVAHSESAYDLTNDQFKSGFNGNAYHISLMGRFPRESIMNTKWGYDGIQPGEGDSFFTKFRIFAARMDDSFDEPLSSYVETRDDEFWSRHLHFNDPNKHFYQAGEGTKMLSWDDVKNYAVGNGIDIGRNTFGLRVESSLWDKKVDNFFDTRNVHSTEGKFLENVTRDEVKWTVTDRLTSKFLGIYQRMPLTHANVDPYIFNSQTGRFFDNNQIEDGKDPSVGTGSAGLEYKFFDWMALNGIWECTNDISLAYDNFPRGILNGGNNGFVFFENGNQYRDADNFLFNQQFFPKPPYPYYNIFKSGLRLTPAENLEFYLDYTRNAYEKAGQVDDNMNHIGFQVAYSPTKKIGIFFKYTFSRWQDLDKLNDTGTTKLFPHHNFFTEFMYHVSQDEDFTFQYGEASRDPYAGGALDIGWDPYGGSLRTIDTQHIVRLYYRRRF